MSVELENLESAVADFDRDADDDFVDPRRLSAAIDRLQGKLCRVLGAARKRGDHLLAGQSACTWVSTQCLMSKTTAADRLCVGEQLGHLPRVAEALSSGQIGYQAAAVICHLSDQIGEKRQYIDEEHWIGYAQRFSLKDLRYLTYEARVRWDCEGFEHQTEEDYELRSLDLSETTGGMYRLDAWLDPVGGAALKAAIESLSNPLGAADHRTAKQRRADALVEMTKQAMDEGRLPRRKGPRRAERFAQPAPALLPPPPAGPRGWMAGDQGGRGREVHRAGSACPHQAPLGRETSGGVARCISELTELSATRRPRNQTFSGSGCSRSASLQVGTGNSCRSARAPGRRP